MDYLEKIKNKITALFDYDKEKREFRAYDAWLFILSSFAVLFILILWFGGTLFWDISHDRFWDTEGVAARTFKDVIDKDRLEQVTERYAKQREVLEARKQTPLSAPDPSI